MFIGGKKEIVIETLEQLKEKRKKALTAIFTLGISALPKAFWAVDTNMVRGTSLDRGMLGFFLRIFFFLILTIPFMVAMVIINIFKVIYYQIEISNYKQ